MSDGGGSCMWYLCHSDRISVKMVVGALRRSSEVLNRGTTEAAAGGTDQMCVITCTVLVLRALCTNCPAPQSRGTPGAATGSRHTVRKTTS